MPRLPKAEDIDVSVALGLLIIAAITHLTSRQFCCRDCCPQCAALDFYHDQVPHIADCAVSFALPQPGSVFVDWLMPEDGTINWPYLVQFWIVPADHVCNQADDPALTTV